MTGMALRAMTMRWKRWGLGVAGAVGVYALAGGWALPRLIERQLPRWVETELERKASIGGVSFNPFTLRLEARDLRLTEADGAPLFGVGALAVELQWRSLVRRAWSLAEIRVTAPSLQLAIAPDGKFNIAQLLETLDKRKKDDSDSGMPRLVVDHFVLERGKVDMHDRHAGYNDTFTPIAFELNHLSTLPDENGNYTLSADAGLGGKLRWKGTAALNPIGGGGLLSLENVALPGVSSYLKSFVRVVVTDGRLSAKLPYEFAYRDGKLDARLIGASLALNALAIRQADGAAPFLQLKSLAVGGVGADLAKRSVEVDKLRWQGGALALRRDARGDIDLANLMVPQAARPSPSALAPGVASTKAEAAAPAPTPTPAPAPAPAPAHTRAAASAPASSPTTVAGAGLPAAPADAAWKLHFKQIGFDDIAVTALDETVQPALKISTDKLKLDLQMRLETAASGLKLNIDDAAFSIDNLALVSGAMAPLKLGRLGFEGGALDLAARRASLARLYADGGELDLSRDSAGRFLFLGALPTSGADAAPKPGEPLSISPPHHLGDGPRRGPSPPGGAGLPWTASAKTVELNKFGARYDDASTGIKARLQDFNLRLTDVGSDLKNPLAFQGEVGLLEGGRLTAKGKVVPATGAVDTELKLTKLALAPVQPLLGKYVKLKLADGNASGEGRLRTGAGGKADPALRYDGSFEVAQLALDEEDNDHFARWKLVRADKLALSLSPNLLDVAELRVVEPNAILIIENDRSFNAQRLLVKAPAPAAAPATPVASAAPAPAASEPFPMRLRRVRFVDGKLDFTDLSLRPQFGAKIYELSGLITGLSSKADVRSQIELDGRVDDFGLARIRGQLNPFVPADNTDVNVVFKNVDMVSASPYSMKFAGYKIAQGKISLDLQYKVRNSQLEGNNQIVLDNLTLGERIDSPDAIKLPLELALAILKDSNGRIDLGVPVSGNMNDPQFSYGAVVWKAIGNILGKIVLSPFRALGGLFGMSGDKLEAVDFDAGSDTVLPPEREKLRQVAKILAGKAQLKLAVPGEYNETADGAALRMQAVRRLVLARADIKLAPGEQPGPLDIGQRKVRGALRDLYAERFGAAELDKQKKAAEAAVAGPAATSASTAGAAGANADAADAVTATATNTATTGPDASGPAAARQKLPMLQRLGKLVQGEPQVADASAFYGKLRERLEQSEPLPEGALPELGSRRAAAIVTALKEAGVDPAAVQAGAPRQTEGGVGKPVALKLGLAAK